MVSLTILFAGGYAVGYIAGSQRPDGFASEGGPALIHFAAIIGYFIVFSKHLGGTLWQRMLKVR